MFQFYQEMDFYNNAMVQLQNKVYWFHVSVLPILDKDCDDKNSIGDLNCHGLIVFSFLKRIITVL